MKRVCCYEKGLYEGKEEVYDENENIVVQFNYKNGFYNGPFKLY